MLLAPPISHTIWNIFLAIIPTVIALIIYIGVSRERKLHRVRWIVWTPMLIVWFLFLPNTCYLFTEWRHYIGAILIQQPFMASTIQSGRSLGLPFGATMVSRDVLESTQPEPHDLSLFLSCTAFYVLYSGCGLVCFYFSIYPIDRLFQLTWYDRGVLCLLCAVGVYLGLMDRFNSWQMIQRPHRIIVSAGYALRDPAVLILIVVFGSVLWCAYHLFDLTMEGFCKRYPRLSPLRLSLEQR